MQKTLNDHITSVFIGRTPVCNLHFDGDIGLMVGRNSQLQDLTNEFIEIIAAYGMEPNAEKSKIMINSTSNVSGSITKDGKSVKYLGATLSKDSTGNAEINMDRHSHIGND